MYIVIMHVIFNFHVLLEHISFMQRTEQVLIELAISAIKDCLLLLL